MHPGAGSLGSPVLRTHCFAHSLGNQTGVSDVTTAPDTKRRTVIALREKKNKMDLSFVDSLASWKL